MHILRITDLTKAGLFAHPKPGVPPGMVLAVSARGMTFNCTFDFEYARLTVTPCPALEPQEFEVDIAKNESGRRYFVCGCCCEWRNYLVLDSGELICSDRYVRQGAGPSKARRDARFKIALETMSPKVIKRPSRPDDPKTKSPAQPPDSASTNTVRSAEHTDAVDRAAAMAIFFSTEKAIMLGRGAAQYDLFGDASGMTAADLAKVETAPDFRPPDQVSRTNAHPVLDINIFRSRMKEGELSARTLCWGERAGPHVEVLFFVDWRGDFPIVIAVHDFVAPSPRWQRLPLTREARGRFRFICPVRGKGCQILYLRDGLFASREAQRLCHPSQRTEGRKNKRIHDKSAESTKAVQ